MHYKIDRRLLYYRQPKIYLNETVVKILCLPIVVMISAIVTYCRLSWHPQEVPPIPVKGCTSYTDAEVYEPTCNVFEGSYVATATYSTPPVMEYNIIFAEPNYEAMFDMLDMQANARISTTAEFALNSSGQTVIEADTIWHATGVSAECFVYEGWQMITNSKSQAYKWRAELFPDWDSTAGSMYAFDDEGFGIVDGRYVVATTDAADGGLATIGQCLDLVLVDGTIIPCIVGDIKSCKDANWTPYGHLAGDRISIIEFCVDKSTWYGTKHANPGRPSCKPEWAIALDYIIIY